MSVTALLVESWSDLSERLDAAGTLARWALPEPVLAPVADCGRLRDALRPGCDPARTDALFGALVRLAAADGGDDQDAVLLVLHLVDSATARLCHRFGADLVLGAITVALRGFPWRRRTRAHAANLLLDTEKALCREVRPNWNRAHGRPSGRGEDVPVDPISRDTRTGLSMLDSACPPPADRLELTDVLLWAERAAVVDREELSMLLEFFYAHEMHGSGHAHVARRHAVTVRTSKRRCAAALSKLRAAAPRYLAA